MLTNPESCTFDADAKGAAFIMRSDTFNRRMKEADLEMFTLVFHSAATGDPK